MISKVIEFGGKRCRERDGPRWIMQGSQLFAVNVELADGSHEGRLLFGNGLSCLLVEFRPCLKLEQII